MYGFSRTDWLEAGLKLLSQSGIHAVTIQSLASALGVSRSGFYYHFTDRQHLFTEMLNYWLEHDGAPLVRERIKQSAPPDARLEIIAEVVDELHLSRFDTAIRQWAEQDPAVKKVWRLEMKKRLAHIRGLIESAGFSGDELELRVRTFVAYNVSAREIFFDLSKEERKKLRTMQIDMLLKH